MTGFIPAIIGRWFCGMIVLASIVARVLREIQR